ncbi:MAG TPA: ferrochelatase [Chloroflexia bacterium]|nr:ferrochelatase [Chloroflexia bacterium]
MPEYVNVSIAVTVFMGLASGGLLTLVLLSSRRQQTSFSIMFGLTGLLAVLGAIGSAAMLQSTAAGLLNGLVLLVLSFTLGYTLTTYSVLSPRREKVEIDAPPVRVDHTAVICLAPGEPPDYEMRSAAERLELADDAADVPGALLRPFYMRDLKGKYAAIGDSPYRDYYTQLVQKVQSRLDSTHRVYPAFYSDEPHVAQAVATCVEEGVRQIIVLHLRVADPPDSVLAGELLEGLELQKHDVTVSEVGPLWDTTLLPQIYVRRVLEAMAQVGDSVEEVGLLLVGRGHPTSGGDASVKRQEQEETFQRRVRRALLKVGFSHERVVIAWLRHGSPSIAEALDALVNGGCKSVYWMPSTYPADGVNTMYDIPAQLGQVSAARGVKLVALGAWNADDLAAQEITSQVRAASRAASGR